MEMKKKYKDEPLSDSRPIIPLVILGLLVSGLSVLVLIDIMSIASIVGKIVAGIEFTVLLIIGLILFFSGIKWPRFIRKNFY